MKWMKLSLSKQIAGTILGICGFSVALLFVVQQWMYSRGVASILTDVKASTLQMKRESARDLLREVKFATEGSLQRNETVQFERFANQQKQLDEVKEFSFIREDKTVALSSDAQRIGKQVEADIWKQCEAAKDFVEIESDDMIAFYQPLRVDADMRRLRPDRKVGFMYGVLCLKFSKDKLNAMAADAESASAAQSRRVLVIVLATSAGNAALVILLSFVLTGRIVKPLRRVVEFAQVVARGNLTGRIDLRRHDELGELASALNQMAETLQTIMQQLATNARTLTSSSTELTSTATQLAGSADLTQRQSSHVAAAATQMSASMKAMSAASDNMSANVRTVASATEELAASIAEIARNAEKASNVAGDAARLAENSDTTISQLGAAADEIGRVIEVIQDIAEQTNLLALNATIEAARAGDAGKGFAVVATEVKELAKQTTDATEDIRQRIGRIQSSSTLAIESIRSIRGVIQQVNDVSRSIASAVEEQSITTKEIATNVAQTSSAAEQMSTSVSESATASEEISANIIAVDSAAQESAQGAQQTRVAGDSLSGLATELHRLVSQFVTE